MTDRSPSKHTAHPRSRGENGAWCGRRVFSMGSSPLTRGKLAPPSGRGHHGGLIPAHAGKTTRGRGQSRSGSAHPRSRGENAMAKGEITAQEGSFPLTRGKRRRFREWPGRTRLIPAHAGKTRQCPPWFPDRTAHPRSRGENSLRFFARVTRAGSSPLTRGKRVRPHQRGCARGLIPAHAGKTGGECGHHLVAPAHPRSRGENTRALAPTPTPGGSSPLTRGKPPAVFNPSEHTGLIPAHAGKTPCQRPHAARQPAHPRSRGENTPQLDM